jgi:hypothetical protein
MPLGASCHKWSPIQQQCIAVDHFNIRQVAHNFAKHFNNAVINFDCNNVRTRFGKCKRERTEARTNLENKITRANICQSRNASNGVWVDNKVLSKGPARR